jgi:hypothetical protein
LDSARSPHRAQAAGLTTRAGLLQRMTKADAAALSELIRSGVPVVSQLRSVGAAVNEVPAGMTAYSHRSQELSVVVAAPRERAADLDEVWAHGVGRSAHGTYLNLETERDDAVMRRAFPPETLARLRAVKRRYDPIGVFDSSLALPE